LAQYEDEFPLAQQDDHVVGDSIYGHRISSRPNVDGYFDDWNLSRDALRSMRGADGPIQFAVGLHEQFVYLYVEVADKSVVYAVPGTIAVGEGSRFSDSVGLVNTSPPYLDETIMFGAEAPGSIISYVQTAYGFSPDPSIVARWQDVPSRGYQLEARIPISRLGTHIGLQVSNTSDASNTPTRSASFAASAPGPFVTRSDELVAIAARRTQAGMRLILTDAAGWRVATAGDIALPASNTGGAVSAWMRIAYEAVVESGQEAELAEPDASGRESQPYVAAALQGEASETWFRSADGGGAVVAVAQPIESGGTIFGALVLQQGTDAILSLTNERLAQLIYVTMIATLVAALALLGYASWLSSRIQRLSVAAEDALENDDLRSTLPSALDGDEVGDLSRSFSHVLHQLGEYNEYLRTLASKLSHELRTPLAIVSSSLENLEHEPLNEASVEYAARAKSGADRLRRILTAMSEASRVEELMQHAEAVDFDVHVVLQSTVAAYGDVYPARRFEFVSDLAQGPASGSPELMIQMLDKLVDNAVDFSIDKDTIKIGLQQRDGSLIVTVTNPGPSLPERMRTQLFDSMVSVRGSDGDEHLGLGLYIAKLISEGHGGSISADNVEGGVMFSVTLPKRD
jgi:dedicated sortase system histidine kinase